MCNEMQIWHDVNHLCGICQARRTGAEFRSAPVLKLRPESVDDESEVVSAAALRLCRVAVTKLGRPGQTQDIVVKLLQLLCVRGNSPIQQQKTENAE